MISRSLKGDGNNITRTAAKPRIAKGNQGAIPAARLNRQTSTDTTLHHSQDPHTALGIQRVLLQADILRVVRGGLDLLMRREEIHPLTNSRQDAKTAE